MGSLWDQDVAGLIIGAGPAGLAVANALLERNLPFVVVEAGPLLKDRRRDLQSDLTDGVGGAGLFSDGKISFHPSATQLWMLDNQADLIAAYSWFAQILRDVDDSLPEIPIFPSAVQTFPSTPAVPLPNEKQYRSIKLSLDVRTRLIERLALPLGRSLLTTARVLSIRRAPDSRFCVMVERGTEISQFVTTCIIFCGGRFGPIVLRQLAPELRQTFQRFEFGVRIEQPSDSFCLANHEQVDPKIILSDGDSSVSYRTFCCCREGVVLLTECTNIRSYSGSSLEHTKQSNVGFNCRLTSVERFEEIREEANRLLAGIVPPFSVSLQAFLKSETLPCFGESLDNLMRTGLTRFADRVKLDNGRILGPCIEGVGSYPSLSNSLQTSVPSFYVAGDATGLFRGLTAALVSGNYVGRIILPGPPNAPMIKIKSSSTEVIRTAFTAQSKQSFYCRDAVCEFVFNKGFAPINPFRLYGYFLNDRVERNIVRRANNQLIRVSDELWVFGTISDGVLFEIKYAENLGKRISFFTIDTRAENIRPIEHIGQIRFEPEVHASQQKRKDLLAEIERLVVDDIEGRDQRLLFSPR